MALDVAVGAFNIGTGAAGTTTAVSGLGFQPKAIIFWWSGRTASTSGGGSANDLHGMGFAVSSSSFCATAQRDLDAAATSNTDQARRNDACILECGDGAAVGWADIQSMDSGGFTLEILDQFTTDLRVSYVAYGGTDITNAEIGSATTANSTGAQTFNNSGNFQPNVTFFMAADALTNSVGSPARINFGAAIGSGTDDQFVYTGRQATAAPNAITNYYCRAGECMAIVSGDDVIGSRCSFTSHNASPGGITINMLEAAAQNFYYLSIKGGSWKVGNVLTQTDTTTAITASGFGFAPKALLFVSAGASANAQDTAGSRMLWSVGAATSTTNRTAQEASSRDGSSTMFCQTFLRTDAVYINVDETSDALLALMDMQSFDSGGFTAIMDDADPSQSFVAYVAAGDAATGTTLTPTVRAMALAGGSTSLNWTINIPTDTV